MPEDWRDPVSTQPGALHVSDERIDDEDDDEIEDAIRIHREGKRKLRRFVKKWNLKDHSYYWILIASSDENDDDSPTRMRANATLEIGYFEMHGSMTQGVGTFQASGRDVGIDRVLEVVRRIPKPRLRKRHGTT